MQQTHLANTEEGQEVRVVREVAIILPPTLDLSCSQNVPILKTNFTSNLTQSPPPSDISENVKT